MLAGASQLDRVTAASGLADVIAQGTIKRCCARAGISPALMRPEDVSRLLPFLEPILRLYPRPDECSAALLQLRRLASTG